MKFTWLCKGCQVVSLVGSLLRVFMRGYNCKIYPNPVPVCGIYLYNCISGLISLVGLKCESKHRKVRWLHLRKSVSTCVMNDGIISDEKQAIIGIPTQWVDSTYTGMVAIYVCTSTYHGLWLKLQWGIYTAAMISSLSVFSTQHCEVVNTASSVPVCFLWCVFM